MTVTEQDKNIFMQPKPGLESLAKEKSKRPRSVSQKGQDAKDLFDTDSEAFSAFDMNSQSSVNLQSQDDSPDKDVDDQPEFDVENVDVSLNQYQNTEQRFQRLVEEAKAEKSKKAKPALQIDVVEDEEEKKLDESNIVRQSLDLPKPLPVPKTKEE